MVNVVGDWSVAEFRYNINRPPNYLVEFLLRSDLEHTRRLLTELAGFVEHLAL